MIDRTIVTALVMFGCHGDAGEPMRLSLAPARPVRFNLGVSPQRVPVTMLVPADFEVHTMNNVVDAARPGPWFPRMELQNPPGPLGEPVILWDDSCKLGDGPGSLEWSVAERVADSNGVLLVCTDPKTAITAVVRNFTWEGHPIQCYLAFGPYEPGPSKARIAEAKEICSSVVLRQPVE